MNSKSGRAATSSLNFFSASSHLCNLIRRMRREWELLRIPRRSEESTVENGLLGVEVRLDALKVIESQSLRSKGIFGELSEGTLSGDLSENL